MPTPTIVLPMLAKLVRTLPEGPQWEYELKLDGYRLQAIKHGDKVRLYSRRGKDFTKPFAPIAASVSRIDSHSLVLDGEAVAVGAYGRPKCQAEGISAGRQRPRHQNVAFLQGCRVFTIIVPCTRRSAF